MSLMFRTALWSLLLTGCTTTTAVNMFKANPQVSAEAAVIYNPSKFIQKIDGETVYKNVFFDPNNIVELMRVTPGAHTIGGLIDTDLQPYGLAMTYKEWKFKFSIKTEPRHTYYVYYELVSGAPAIFARDLGENFVPVVTSYADTWKFKSPAERAKNYPYYEQLKTQGADHPVEILR